MSEMSDFIESVLPGLLVLLILFLTVSKSKKAKKAKAAKLNAPVYSGASASVKSGKVHGKDHTHDRLDDDCFDPLESPADHYRKQLDSFLSAGLIDRAEYRELNKRYGGKP